MPWEIYDPANPNENVFFGGSDVVSQRYILTLNGVNSYIQLGDIEVTPSDTLSFKLTNFVIPTAAGARFLGSSDFAFSIDTGADGDRFRLVGCTASLNGSPITSEVTIIPTSGVHDVEVTPSVTKSINAIGCKSGTFDRFVNAALFDFKINDGSVYNYPIDDNSTTVIRNAATVLGAERVVNGNFSTSTDWTLETGWTIQNGRAELISDGTVKTLRQDNVFEIGKTYLVEFDVFSDSSAIGFQNGSGQIVSSGTSGRVSAVFVADTAHLLFKRVSDSPIGWIDNVSVKEADGYAKPVNVTPSMWSLINV